jgi:Tfp pilus assembly protein PilV
MLEPRTKKLEAGFTLIETLIAISILILAVTGAFAAAQNGISSAIFSKDQIVAFYLAQEGVETIRNRRDQNGLAGANWLSGIAEAAEDPCLFGSVCRVDAINQTITKCSGGLGSCPNLKLNNSGFYAYDSGNDTQFRREIVLEQVSVNEAAITVIVSWSKGLVQRSFRARENIFNWQ